MVCHLLDSSSLRGLPFASTYIIGRYWKYICNSYSCQVADKHCSRRHQPFTLNQWIVWCKYCGRQIRPLIRQSVMSPCRALSKGFTVWNGLHKHRKRGRNLVSGKTSSQTQRFQKGLQRTPIQQEPNHEVSTSVMSWWHSNPICMFPLIKVISCRGKEIHRSSEYSHNKQRMRLQMSHTPLCCTNLVYPSCAVCRFDTFLHTGREPTARD